jgi:hypothetical protein
MGEDLKQKDAGPDEQHRKMPLAIPDDTEGHKRDAGEEPLGAQRKMPLAIPDTEGDTEGHKH